MRIGILTVYFADYGSFFHTYALYNYLINLGHDCEIINACGRMRYSPRLNLAVKSSIIFPDFVKNIIANRVDAYRTYLNLHSNISQLNVSAKYKDICSFSKKYDCIIVGSDELWSATNPNIRFVPEYFGLNLDCPVLSYATSGVTLKDPSPEMQRKIRKGLLGFESIAVRDKVTAEWVGNLLEREIDIVLDPTLLNPCFAGQEEYINEYILVYGEHFSNEQIDAIKDFSYQQKKPVKSVSWKHKWCDEYLETESAEKLQYYFKNSYYVMTSTFHGTIFAIVNRKPFTSFTTELRGVKVKLLLEQLELENRLFENGTIGESIQYEKTDRLLTKWQEHSKKYLENALTNISKRK